jgi:hypothetical protein
MSLTFAVVTILLSWSFIQFIFAFHYAHEFYADHRGKERGLAFPNDEAPWLRVMIGLGEEAIDAKSRESRNDVTWAWNGGGRFSPAERSHGFRPNRDRHLPDT